MNDDSGNPAFAGHAAALASYHEQITALYQPILSCPWPRQNWPGQGSLAGLAIEDLPRFQKAIGA